MFAAVAVARADDARPIVGARVVGKTKVTETTTLRLAHLEPGDRVSSSQLAQIKEALLSSELFTSVEVALEDAPGGGVRLVATLDDKQSWIAAPTVYVLPSTWAVGVGYAENDLLGENKKMLLYGQVGNRSTFLFGTYFDPEFLGTHVQLRFDLYPLHRIFDEYANPPDMARSNAIARTTTQTFLDAGALIGYQLAWWAVADVRLRGAYVYYRDTKDGAGNPLPTAPQDDGWDISLQARITLDHRLHLHGVTWGPYLQAQLEPSLPVPNAHAYIYQLAMARAYYSWRLFGEHELEVRTLLNAGHHLPFHQEQTGGGVQDLRGYALEQFRGDTRVVARAEYSVPLATWKFFAFRGLTFFDSTYVGYHFAGAPGRDYLPTEHDGAYWFRTDVGAGFRVYVSSIVLPLLGLDVGYGLEGHRTAVYFEVGLTDF